MSKNVLIAENLTLRFPLTKPASRWRMLFGNNDWGDYHEALKNISFKVAKGTIIGIIGRNGAGKSSLLRALVGLYPLHKGKVLRFGHVGSLLELGGAGGIFITGRQYVIRWLRMNGVSKNEMSRIIKDVREFSELHNRLDDPIYTYSSGMAARLYFATATSIDHDIYLIDEILSVGDAHFNDKCWGRIRSRLKEGVSGVLVTHDWSAVIRICKQAIELKGGQVLSKGDSYKVVQDYLDIQSQLTLNSPVKFSKNLPSVLTANSSKEWSFTIPIENKGKKPVLFNFTIEKLVIAEDWQIIFFGKETLVASSAGNYVITINIAKLPLPPGEYHLNLFLNGQESNGIAGTAYDTRGWTTGNSIRLIVDGESKAGLVLMPFKVKLK